MLIKLVALSDLFFYRNVDIKRLPLLAKVMKLDPAVMAGPFITSIVDAVSLLIYFLFAKMLLGL